MDFLRHLNAPLVIVLVLGGIYVFDKIRCILQESIGFQRVMVRLFPKKADGHLFLGYALYSKKAYEEAEKEIRRAIVLEPRNRQHYYVLADILWKKASWKQEMEKLCSEIFEHFPHDPYGYLLLACWHQNQDQFKEAEEAFRKAISIAPRFAEAHERLADLLFRLDRPEEAQQIYLQHPDLLSSDNAAYYLNAAQALSKQGDSTTAFNAVRKAIERAPNNARAHVAAGQLMHLHLKRFDEAEKYLRKAIQLSPDDPVAYQQYGYLLANQPNRLDEAEQAFRKAIEVDPRQPERYLSLGWLLEDKMHCFEEAEQEYRKAIALDTGRWDAYACLGLLLHAHLHRYAEAEDMFLKALQLQPDDEPTLYNVACTKSCRGDTEEAFDYLRKAIEHGSDRAWAWDDSDLEPLRTDPRFIEIVGQRPQPEPVAES